MQIKYKRVLIKLSGEALAGEEGSGLDRATLERVAKEIKEIHNLGAEIGLVVGGGNFWRGRYGEGMNKASADYMGMLATVINALALQDVLEKSDVPTRVQSAIAMNAICEPFIMRKAIHHLEKGRVVIFAAGTGNPFFTTDTAAALRAVQIGADIILLAKNVDAVYSSDPKEDKEAERYSQLHFEEVLQKNLRVMDLTAITLCKEENMPIKVFALNDEDSLLKAISGENSGTIIN